MSNALKTHCNVANFNKADINFKLVAAASTMTSNLSELTYKFDWLSATYHTLKNQLAAHIARYKPEMHASKFIKLLLISTLALPNIAALPRLFDSDMIIRETPIEYSRSTRDIRLKVPQTTGAFTDVSPVFHFLNARRAENARVSIVIPEIRKIDDSSLMAAFLSKCFS